MEYISAGIEAINFYGGSAFLDVKKLAVHRKLDTERFENLLMKQKTVPLCYEDSVSFAVNAAKPLLDKMTEAERDRIEMLVTCTETGLDMGKSLSTYIHDYLGLNRNMRLFELKGACYSGTAGFQNALNFILAKTSPGAKALVIATDMAKFISVEGGETLSADWSFAEPSSGGGAVAMIVSSKPEIFNVDIGANGYYGYEIMDTCRPLPDSEAGNADASLMSYLDCCQAAFQEYKKRVPEADFETTFRYLVFHTPFGGMTKGAHRTMMKRLFRKKNGEIEEDFEKRVMPGLKFCQRVGNLCGGTIFLALSSTIANGDFSSPKRLGCFSYGSGCCSEFYSGTADSGSQQKIREMKIAEALDNRYELSIPEYEEVIKRNIDIPFGVRDADVNLEMVPEAYRGIKGTNRLVLNRIREYHREYIWI